MNISCLKDKVSYIALSVSYLQFYYFYKIFSDRKDFTWYPKPSSLICCAHFIGNKRSEEENSPSYVPTKFTIVNTEQNVSEICTKNRHDRFMKTRF